MEFIRITIRIAIQRRSVFYAYIYLLTTLQNHVLFNSLEKLVHESTVDVLAISLLPVEKLVKYGQLDKAILFVNKIINLDPIFKNRLSLLYLALDYIKTENSDILEKIHKEYRDLIINIISKISPKTSISQQILNSL